MPKSSSHSTAAYVVGLAVSAVTEAPSEYLMGPTFAVAAVAAAISGEAAVEAAVQKDSVAKAVALQAVGIYSAAPPATGFAEIASVVLEISATG